jgi:TonB family protein
MKSLRVFGLSFLLLFSGHAWSAVAAGFTKPEPVATPQPRLPEEFFSKPSTAYAQLQVNEFGFVVDATIVQSSDPRVNEPVLNALRRWKFRPATEDGEAVSCYVVQPVRISNGIIFTAPEAPEDRDPSVKHSYLPELPRELRAIDGYVTARVQLDANGVVTRAEISDSTHAELDEYVLAAVGKWSFNPAVKEGVRAPSVVAIPFRFKPDPRLLPKEVTKVEEIPADSGPVVVRRVTPELPASVVGQDATAEVEFVVDQFGNVVNATVVETTHDAFAASAVDAITRWRFKPAVQDGEAIATRVRQKFVMQKQVFLADRTPVDSQPRIRKTVSPEVPSALRGVKGQVDVWIAIDEDGNVTDAQVRNATYEEFSEAALTAARQWKFTAAVRDGQAVASTVVVPFLFGP